MQDIRRATKKHRKLLLAVVILLLVGLVGSFATWNSGGRSNTGGAGVNGESTLEQRIAAQQDYITALQQNEPDYNNSLTLADAYMDLSELYWNKNNEDTANIPALLTPELDENGAEIPFTAEQEAEQAKITQEREAAQAIATLSHENSINAAGWADYYYNQALESAPEGLNDAAIADARAKQANAREVQGDTEGALAFMEEAYRLNPDSPEIVYSLAVLHQNLDHMTESLMFFMQARQMAPEDLNIAYGYATSLFVNVSPEEGVKEMEAYRDSLPEGHPYLETANSYVENLQAFAEMFAGWDAELETQEGVETTEGEGEQTPAAEEGDQTPAE